MVISVWHRPNRVFSHEIGICPSDVPLVSTVDHVTAWSKGDATDLSNCQMLCKPHNRAKGNR